MSNCHASSDYIKDFCTIFDNSRCNLATNYETIPSESIYCNLSELKEKFYDDKTTTIDILCRNVLWYSINQPSLELLSLYESILHENIPLLLETPSTLNISAYLYLGIKILKKYLSIEQSKPLNEKISILQLLKNHYTNPFGLALILCDLTNHPKNMILTMTDVVEILCINFLNHSCIIRKLTLHILSFIERNHGYPSFFVKLMEIEEVPPDFYNYRARNMMLLQFSEQICSQTLNSDSTLRLFLYFLISHYSINLNVIWPHIDELITKFYRDVQFQAAFSKIWTFLINLSFENIILIYNENKQLEDFQNEDDIFMISTDKTRRGNKANIWRSVLKISINFKTVITQNMDNVIQKLMLLVENPHGESILASTPIEYFYDENKSSTLCLWKELVVFSIKCLGTVKNIKSKPFADDVFRIIELLIVSPLPEISKSAIQLISLFKQKIEIDCDFLLELHDLKLPGLRQKICSFAKTFDQFPNSFGLFIRALLSVTTAAKSRSGYSSLFLNLLNQDVFDADRFRNEFVELLTYPFNKILDQSPLKFVHHSVASTFIGVFKKIVEGLGMKLSSYMEKIITIVLYIGSCCNEVLGSQLIAKRYHQIYKSIRKDLIYLVSDIFKISFNFNPFFPNIQSVMISPLIKNHRNNDLSASLFLELAYGISHSHNHLLLSTYDSHFLLEYVVDCLFEKHSDPKRANIILQILSSFFKFYKEKNSKLLQLSKNVPQIISHLIKNANFLTIDIHVLLEFTLTISCFSTQNELNCGSNGNLLLSLIMKFSTKKSGFAKKHENELVKAASNLIQHSKELPQAVLVSLLSWQFNLSHDHLRSKIYESLTNIGFLDTCVLEVLHNLNSWSNLGDENGPDVTLRCSTLRKIDSNFLQKYNDKQSLVYLIFLAALKSFLSCSNHYLTSDSFCCFLDLSFPVIKSFGGFYYDKIYFYLSGSCKKLLHSKEEIQFQSGICLLHGLTRNHMFESLHAFLIDSDVFVNLSHIQISLRMAGLNQLKSVIASLPIDKPFIEDFLLPIVLYFLNCITSANNKAHNLTTEAISVLSVIVRKISWNQYLKLIKIYINNSHLLYDEGLKLHKLRTRILSAILENFSFQISETSSSTCVARAEVVNLVQQLVTKLYSKPIGEENKELVPSFTELNYSIIKAPLSLVIIHLLKLLNDSTINSHVRGIISHLVEMLASPHKDMRISARSILAKSVKVLGPGYFKIVLNEMYATLKDGFQKHVFTYTAHHIMSSLSSSFSEDINDSIGILIEAIISDHFGAAYEERQVHAITSKTKEAYTGKGFNISQFLGSHVQHEKIYNFLSAFSKLNTVMNSYSAIKIVEKSFNRYLKGLLTNPHLSGEQLFIFSHLCIRDFMPGNENSESLQSSKIVVINSRLLPPDPRKQAFLSNCLHLQISHLIVCFGLKLLYSLIRRQNHDSSQPPSKSMIEPNLKYILQCIESPFIQVAMKSLDCLKLMLLSDNEEVINQVDELLQVVYSYVREMFDQEISSDDILSGVKLLIILLKKSKNSLEDSMISNLLIFCESNLHSSKSLACLSLLRVLIRKKIVSFEILPIISTVRVISVTNEDVQIRRSCSDTILLFLIKYKKQSLVSFIEFYLSNFKYESVVGRQAALETMTRVLTKIKQKRWSKYNDDIFIRIIELLTNDDDEDTRNIAYSSLKILIAQSSENAHQKYIKLSLSWLSNLKLGLMESGCLVIHALLEHQESFLGLHSHSLQLIFDSSVKFFEFVELQQESNSQNTKRGFEIIGYKLINLISEIHYKTKFSSIVKFSEFSKKCFDFMCSIIAYPHLWVKQACSELLIDYFLHVSISTILSQVSAYINDPSVSLQIWVPLINQIHILIDNSIELSNSYLSTLTAHEKGLKLLLILTELFVGLSQISQSLVDISLDDLFKRLVKCSNIENQLKSNKIRCRLTLLKWIAAVVVFADKKSKIRDPQKSIITIDINFLNDILYIINRELFSKKKSPLLNSTAKNVLDVLKKSVNPKLFLNAMNNYKTLKTRDAKLRHSLHVVGKAKDPKKYHQSKIRKRLSKSVNKRFENSSKLH